jgi:hypothetical protein
MRLPYKENLEDTDLEIEVTELLKETKLDVENIVILPIQTDEGVRFNLHFVTSLEEVGLVDENSSTYQMED